MSPEPGRVSRESLFSLQSCLVEGDTEQLGREKRVRRRALVISIATESVVLGALVLIPLLGRPDRIALANVVPLPPYYHANHRPASTTEHHPAHPNRNVCRVCPTARLAPILPTDGPQPVDRDPIPGTLEGPAMPDQVPLGDSRLGLQPPPPPPTHAATRQILHRTHIDPALLTHRVEPIYPPLMRQIGRSGQVELRAIIATDGSIQSLQVVGGDPGFYQSALDAVRQWRYTPTILNGQAVEVDTYIAVIYRIGR